MSGLDPVAARTVQEAASRREQVLARMYGTDETTLAAAATIVQPPPIGSTTFTLASPGNATIQVNTTLKVFRSSGTSASIQVGELTGQGTVTFSANPGDPIRVLALAPLGSPQVSLSPLSLFASSQSSEPMWSDPPGDRPVCGARCFSGGVPVARPCQPRNCGAE